MASSADALHAARQHLRTTTTVVRSLPGAPPRVAATTTTTTMDTKSSQPSTVTVAPGVSTNVNDDLVEYTHDELRAMHRDHFSTNMDAMLATITTSTPTPTTAAAHDGKQSSGAIPTLPLISQRLTIAQAQALLVLHQNRHQPWTRKPHSWHNMSHETARHELGQLTKQLQVLMNDMPAMARTFTGCTTHGASVHDGAFVKLSCRSAKDVEPSADKRRELYERALHTCNDDDGKPQYGDVTDGNARLCALYQSQIHSLRYIILQCIITILQVI